MVWGVGGERCFGHRVGGGQMLLIILHGPGRAPIAEK